MQLFTALILPAVSVSTGRETGEQISGSHRAWLDNHQARAMMRRVWAEWFREYDVLLCPVMPMTAFAHDQRSEIAERSVLINGRPRPHMETLAWTGLVGVVYLPSTVAPVGFTPGGLPVGIQVVGPYLEDRTSLFVAARLAELAGGYVAPPGA